MSSRDGTVGGASRPAVRRSVWWLRGFIALLTLLTGALVLAVSTVLFGFVHGVEFSPNTFRRRNYVYYEAPLVRVQVCPITRATETHDLESYLRRRLVRPKTPNPPRWDLVYSDRVGADPVEGDAAILCAYLDALDETGSPYWLAWSKKHPPLARVLWPVVAHTARRHLYLFIPDLFRVAQHARSPAPLQKSLDQALSRQYAWLAAAQQHLGDHRTAIQLYTEGLQHEPHNEALLRGRARSLESLGQQWRAQEDLARADSIRRTDP